jgi:hypothetical protein
VCLAAATAAQEPASLARWEWFQEVRLPAPAEGGYYLLTLPPAALGKARPDLHDLRLVDAAGKLVPHAARVRRDEFRQEPVAVRQRFDAGRDEKQRFVQVRLELEGGGHRHNEVEVETPGVDYRRRAVVRGAPDAEFKDALTLADGHLFLFDLDGRLVGSRRLRYAPQTARFLEVRVYADGKEPLPEVGKVTVRHAVAIKGEEVTLPAFPGPRQDVRGDGGPGSAWFIELGGERVPVSRLTLEVEPQEVERPFRVEVAEAKVPRFEVLGAEWRWRIEGERRLAQVDFPEVTASRLRLVVTDFANPPLVLRTVSYSAAARQVVFARKGYAGPLRLYYGNPAADPPRYDFERTLPATLKPAPQAVPLEERQPNPSYQPPPLPLHERAPWLVYAALSLASVALLVLLGLLAREAVRRSDSARREQTTAR